MGQCFLASYILFLSLASFAAETTTTQVRAKTKSTSININKKDKKAQREALSQGYSASEALLMSQSRWNAVISQSAARGFDEFNDAVFSNTSLDLSYRLNKKSALIGSVRYSSIAYQSGGALFDNEVDNPRRFGFGDLFIGYSRPNVWKRKSQSVNYFTSITLPTSSTSLDATMIASNGHSLIYRYRPNGKWIFSANLRANLSAFEFDDVDTFGSQVNSPFGVGTGIGLAYRVLKTVITTINYSQYQRFDYDENWDSIQTISAMANWNATAHGALFVGYRYRDRVFTNDELFDDDRSLFFTGGSYAF